MHDEDNDGRFPDDSPVEVRYPRSKQEEQGARELWPWLPGTIVERCGPNEWYVCIEVASLPCCAGGEHRAVPPRGTCTTRVVTVTARRSDRGQLVLPPQARRARWAGERRPADPRTTAPWCGVVCAMAAFAAVVAYSHIYSPGHAHAQDGTVTRLPQPSVDGLLSQSCRL